MTNSIKMNYLYDVQKHTNTLSHDSYTWDDNLAKSTIKEIYHCTLANFDPELFWKTDPEEDSVTESNKTVYNGASGIAWALIKVSEFLNQAFPLETEQLFLNIYRSYLLSPDSNIIKPSFLLGESGILLLLKKYSDDFIYDEKIYNIIKKNINEPSLDPLWSGTSTMNVAFKLYQMTKQKKWIHLYMECFDLYYKLLFEAKNNGRVIWDQANRKKHRYTGAGHGFTGNIHSMLLNIDQFDDLRKKTLLDYVAEVLTSLACKKSEGANWAPTIPNTKKSYEFGYLQWCHGAPGIITSLKNFPVNYSQSLEKLMIQAGHLIWTAGPLKKGVGICHGTDGNGFAFLHLFRRTQDPLWLMRARVFAMYAIKEQQKNRSTLFTGQMGLAMFLMGCLKKDDRFPILDYI